MGIILPFLDQRRGGPGLDLVGPGFAKGPKARLAAVGQRLGPRCLMADHLGSPISINGPTRSWPWVDRGGRVLDGVEHGLARGSRIPSPRQPGIGGRWQGALTDWPCVTGAGARPERGRRRGRSPFVRRTPEPCSEVAQSGPTVEVCPTFVRPSGNGQGRFLGSRPDQVGPGPSFAHR